MHELWMDNVQLQYLTQCDRMEGYVVAANGYTGEHKCGIVVLRGLMPALFICQKIVDRWYVISHRCSVFACFSSYLNRDGCYFFCCMKIHTFATYLPTKLKNHGPQYRNMFFVLFRLTFEVYIQVQLVTFIKTYFFSYYTDFVLSKLWI